MKNRHMHKRILVPVLLPLIVFSILITSCKEEKFEVSTEARLNVFLTGLSLDFAAHLKSINLQKYKFVAGSENRYKNARSAFQDFIFSEVNRQTISGWYSRRGYIDDPYLKRQVVLLANLFLVNTVDYEKSVESSQYILLKDFLNLRFTENDEEITLSEAVGELRRRFDTKRYDIYENITKKTEPLKDMIVNLIKLRNKTAAAQGHSGYPELVFRAEEIEAETLDTLLKTLESKTEDVYKNYLKRVQIDSDSDYRDIKAIFSPSTSIDFRKGLDSIRVAIDNDLKNIGIDARMKIEYLKMSTNYPPTGFTIAIPGKYRFIIPETGSSYIDFYEFVRLYGIGVYYTHLVDTKRILSGFGSVTGARSRIFTSMIGHLSRLLLQELYKAGKSKLETRPDKFYDMYNLRRRLMMADFEWSLYIDPDINPDRLYRNLVKRYLMVDLPKDAGTDWAAHIELVDSPFYTAMDILGEIAAHQVLESLHSKIGKDNIASGKYGQWLRNKLYRFGELYPWWKKVHDITAEELSVKAIARSF